MTRLYVCYALATEGLATLSDAALRPSVSAYDGPRNESGVRLVRHQAAQVAMHRN